LNIRFPNNNIRLRDEVISLNDIYCEHIRNVTKFIETTHIYKICLKHSLTQIVYTEELPNLLDEPLVQPVLENNDVRKRFRSNGI